MLKNLLTNIPSIINGQIQREKKRVTYKKLVNQMSYGSLILRAVDKGRDFIFYDFYGASDVGCGLVKSNLIGASLVDTFSGVKSFGLFKVFQDVYRSGIPAKSSVFIIKNDFVLFWHEIYMYKLPTGDIVFISKKILKKNLDRKSFLRCDDIGSRFGGGEFLMILMNTGIGSAKELISRVLEKCRSHEFSWDKVSFRITFSAGVCDASELGGRWPHLTI